MNFFFHLSTCNTCQRIIKELNLPADVELQDIKTKSITKEQVELMKEMAGSYEAIFSKRARNYRGLGLHEKDLSEADLKQLILDDYTFLKRPVLILDEQIFVGNTKNVVQAAKVAIPG